MIRTLHVVLFCFTWLLVRLGDRVLEIREIEVRIEALRQAGEVLQQRPSAQVEPGGSL